MQIKKINVNYSILQAMWLLFCIFMLKILNIDYAAMPQFFYCLVIISIILGVFFTSRLAGTTMNIPTLFLIISYVFHHGQHIVAFFGIKNDYLRGYIMTDFGNPYILRASVISLIMINVLQLSFCLFMNTLKIDNRTEHRLSFTQDSQTDNRIRTWGMILFFVCIIPTLYYDINRLAQSFISSYAETYTYGFNSLTDYASKLLEISLFALIYVNRNNNNWKYIYYPKMGWELIKLILIGNRMAPISSILAFYFFKNYLFGFKKLKRSNKIVRLLLFVLGIFLMGFISTFRANRYGSIIQSVIQAFTTKNFFISFLTESGTTLLDQVLLLELIPSTINYAYGMTYIGAISIIIPFSTRIFGTSSLDHISVGGILNNYWYNHGLGGSLIAEAYYNFGWLSFVFFFLLGYAICKYQDKYNTCAINGERPLLFIMLSFLMKQLLIYPRGYFYAIISSLNVILYSLVLYYVMFKVNIRNNKTLMK